MDASDDKTTDLKLREILGYLHTLGVNIQKRTQHLLDNKINADYLSNVKNLEKVAEKVNTICSLSVSSLNKVNNGVKVTIEQEKLSAKTSNKKVEEKNISLDGTADGIKKHKSYLNKPKHSSHTSSRKEVEDIKVPECKRKRITVGKEEVSLPEDVELNLYTSCHVRLLPEDSKAVLDFARINSITMDTESFEDTFSTVDYSHNNKHEKKKKSRIQSRPRHSQLTDHSLPGESLGDDTCVLNNVKESCSKETSLLEDSKVSLRECDDSLDKKNKEGWEKAKKFKRIFHSDSSEEEDGKKNILLRDTKQDTKEIKSNEVSDSQVSLDVKSSQEKESKSSTDEDDHKKSSDKKTSDKKRSSESRKSSQDGSSSHRSSDDRKTSHRSSEDKKSSHRSSEGGKSSYSRSSEDKRSHHKSSEDRKSCHRSSEDGKSSHRSSEDRKSSHRSSEDRKSHHRSSEDKKSSEIRSPEGKRSSDSKRSSEHKKPSDSKKSSNDRILLEANNSSNSSNCRIIESCSQLLNTEDATPNINLENLETSERNSEINDNKSIADGDETFENNDKTSAVEDGELDEGVTVEDNRTLELTGPSDNNNDTCNNSEMVPGTEEISGANEDACDGSASQDDEKIIDVVKSGETEEIANKTNFKDSCEGNESNRENPSEDKKSETDDENTNDEDLTLQNSDGNNEEFILTKSNSERIKHKRKRDECVEESQSEHCLEGEIPNESSSVSSKRITDIILGNNDPDSNTDGSKTKDDSIISNVNNSFLSDCENDDRNNLEEVLDTCDKIIAEVMLKVNEASSSENTETETNRLSCDAIVTNSSKDDAERLHQEPDSLARQESKDQPGSKEDPSESPPYYPSDNEGFGDMDQETNQIEQVSVDQVTEATETKQDSGGEESVDKLEEKSRADSDKEDENNKNLNEDSDAENVPRIRCVDINNLLSKDIKENSLKVTVPSHIKTNKKNNESPKKHKNVTFLDTPIRIKNSSRAFYNNNSGVTSSPKVIEKPTSILLNNKSKYSNCWSSTVIELSDSDSDVSNTSRELMKNIKNKILGGQYNTFVSVSNDAFYSTNYTESLGDHGVKKIYNEYGKLCFSERQKKLNEDAKKSVLTSSSSDEAVINTNYKSRKREREKPRSTGSSSDSDSESSDFERRSSATKRRKKKFTKKRHRKNDPDSDAEIRNLVKFPKSKRRRKSNRSSDESSDNGKKNSGSSSDNEMGRSARLKQREAPTAFTQSTKDRNESDSSSSSSSLIKAKTLSSSSNNKDGKNLLLNTLMNGNANKSASDTDQSMTDSKDCSPKFSTASAANSKPVEIPLVDTIKNDLLEDESSSSALESTPKVNGKNSDSKKKMKINEDIKKALIQDSDDEPEETVEPMDSDVEDSKDNRPSSTINLDTDSDESVKITKPKVKKSAQNGKKESGDSDVEETKEGKSGSDSNESEIFVANKRKRKQNKKSSSSNSDEENSQDSDSTEKKKKRKRIKKMSGDESSEQEGSDSEGDGNRKGRKNIRALKKTSTLDSATREAAKKERERLARIAERQKLYNESMFDESGGPEEITKLDKIVLDFDPKTKDPIISVDKGLVEKLKPHQANGIKFMWNACFESVKQINTSKGSGCILAHCMGLGKTLQVVTLVHTLLVHREKTKVERVLVVCPLSTVLNWVNEFRMWLEHAESDEEINIYELSRYKQNHERANQLKEWLEYGGVCILGYDMFRNLSADNPKKFRKAQLTSFQKALVEPGPHLVVCDEGHLLKNEKTSLSQSMNRVKTLRRIVLTGTPLQNNLKEYYCMVQFVKPNLLGKYSEYLNRFVNPITNGQYTNSTEHDIRVMKRRSHVLHKMLDGAVQRRDYAVLAPFLPPKHEYVLFISLTEIQIKLYRHYLENYSRRPNPDRKTTPSLFSDFQSLQRIWTHPLVLKANSERYELMQQKKRDKEEEEEDTEGSLADFIDDEEETTTPEETSMSESEDSDDSSDRTRKKKKKNKNTKTKHKRVTRATAVTTVKDEDDDDDVMEVKTEEPKAENPTEWWISLCSEDELNDIRHSNKLLLLLDILKQCEAIGDKLLVFSQSLYSLDLIEQFLSKIDEATQKGSTDDHLGGHSGSWSQGLDYFRLDGSTSCENRAIWCKAFNREDNPRARLFLISTRAGGLGINLVAANRVVIFDMSWNPSHDVQSIFRVYRFGQKKPCYIYRFLALGTMEEKIYERQVTKQAISKRVIDEQQIDRHYTESDLAELYMFCPEPEGSREVPILPKDRLFADLLKQHDTVIYKYHEHDSLLENKEEETLTEEERKAAWEDYENEKTRPPPTFGGTNWLLMQQQQQQQQMTINALQAVLRQDYPTLTEQQITAMIPAILQQMHNNGDAALTQKLTAMMAAQNNMMGGQMPGFKYNPNMLTHGMMMNPGGMGMGIRNPMYQQAWQQQQQQLQMQQRLQQQQAMQANLKYYAGGLGSRDLMDMAALQQQQRALLLGNALQPARGRPPKTVLRPPRPINATEIVDLDSE